MTDLPPIAALLDAASGLLHLLAGLLAPLVGATSSVLAIVLVTLLLRAALVPLGRLQVRAEVTRRRLAPALAELRRRHAKKPEVLSQKTMELYRREKASPWAGILPALAQAPVLSLVYGVFTLHTIAGHPNTLLDAPFAGAGLGDSALVVIGRALGGGSWLDALAAAAVLVVLAVVALLTRAQTLRYADAPVAGDAAAATAHRTLRITASLSFLTVVFAAVAPLAAAVYLSVSTAWTLVEREVLRRRMGVLQGGGLAPSAAAARGVDAANARNSGRAGRSGRPAVGPTPTS